MMSLSDLERQDRIQREQLQDAYDLIELYDTKFRSRYRMSKDAVVFVCNITKEALQRPIKRQQSIPMELQILAALRFYVNGYW